LGNGFSASLSLEARRTTQLIGAIGTAITGGGSINGGAGFGGAGLSGGSNGYAGWKVPDIVANLRVDQAWDSAAIAGALHQVNAPYYVNASGVVNPEGSGHPDDEWGWAIMAGLRLNTPTIGQGDYLQLQAIYTHGASRYLMQNPNSKIGGIKMVSLLPSAFSPMASMVAVFPSRMRPTSS
jgi:Porin subfamily